MWPLATLAFVAFAHDPLPPEVTESRAGDAYVIDGRFTVLAPVEVVWAVLSDYSHFSQFVSSVNKSEVVSRNGRAVVIDQEATAKLGPFSRTMHLRLAVREAPGHALSFRDVSGQDFVRQEGSWSISETELCCIVTYHLIAEPRVVVPSFIEGSVFKDTAVHLLTEVRNEIEKRAALALAGDHP